MRYAYDLAIIAGGAIALAVEDWRPFTLAVVGAVGALAVERLERQLRVKPPKRIARKGWGP